MITIKLLMNSKVMFPPTTFTLATKNKKKVGIGLLIPSKF